MTDSGFESLSSHLELTNAQQRRLGATVKIQTVTAAILVRAGKVLIARRPASDILANKWEFPGGKVEDGETPQACLARELNEELGIDVRVGTFFGESFYHYEHGSIRLLAYRTFWEAGELDPKVHGEIRWVTPRELDQYDFAPADLPFVQQLQKSRLVLTSEDCFFQESF